MTETVLGELARNGTLGIVAVMLIVALRSVYRDYQTEVRNRVDDSHRLNASVIQAHATNHEMATKMAEVLAELRTLRDEAQRKKQIREMQDEADRDRRRQWEQQEQPHEPIRERLPTGKHRPYERDPRDGE